MRIGASAFEVEAWSADEYARLPPHLAPDPSRVTLLPGGCYVAFTPYFAPAL
jgi:hypothetical protein